MVNREISDSMKSAQFQIENKRVPCNIKITELHIKNFAYLTNKIPIT